MKSHECAATTEKICNECGDSKPLSEFHKDKNCRFGVRNKCKECARQRSVNNYHANRHDRVSRKRRYNAETKERRLGYLREYRSDPEKKALIAKLRNAWNKANPGRKAANDRRAYIVRRRSLGQACSSWVDDAYIADLYSNAKEANAIFKRIGLSPRFEVDHIVPLRNKRVSGLHNQFNLQILTREQNLSKYNHFQIG